MIKDTYKTAFKNIGKAFKQLLFYEDKKCEICHKEGDVICGECAKTFPRHKGKLCTKCGRQIDVGDLCFNCKKHKRPYEQGVIALFYQDKAKQLMSDFKFNSHRYYAEFSAKEIHNKIKDNDWNIDVIVSVPMHPIKLTGKGYNPPSLIAKELSLLISRPYDKKALKRKRHTKSMSLLKNIDRMEHSRKNFMMGKENIAGKTILIIDDVSTTGATLHVCSSLLKDKGAERVYVAAACGDSV